MQKNKISNNFFLNIMCKKMIKAAFVAAIAMVSGINAFNAQKSEPLSDIALANVEALAQTETSGSCTEVCYECEGWMCTRIYNGETSRCINYRKK